MRFTLKDYQVTATNDLVKVLRRDTKERMQDDEEFYSVALSAPTGAGKTVIASAVTSVFEEGLFSRTSAGACLLLEQVPLRFERRGMRRT